jgi:hypothetical protein
VLATPVHSLLAEEGALAHSQLTTCACREVGWRTFCRLALAGQHARRSRADCAGGAPRRKPRGQRADAPQEVSQAWPFTASSADVSLSADASGLAAGSQTRGCAALTPNLSSCPCPSYEEGANLSKRDELLAAARQLGLPADEVEAWLGSTEAGAAVEEDDREAKEGCVLGWGGVGCGGRSCMLRAAMARALMAAARCYWSTQLRMQLPGCHPPPHRSLPCRRGIHSVPAFLVSCGASREVALVGAESVRAFEAAFRKAAHEAEGTPRLGQRQAAAERKRGTASAPAAEE